MINPSLQEYNDMCVAAAEAGGPNPYKQGISDAGFNNGYSAGELEGFEKGIPVGYEQGKEDTIKTCVKLAPLIVVSCVFIYEKAVKPAWKKIREYFHRNNETSDSNVSPILESTENCSNNEDDNPNFKEETL